MRRLLSCCLLAGLTACCAPSLHGRALPADSRRQKPGRPATTEQHRPPARPSRLPRPEGHCLSIRTIDEWRAVDDYTIELRARPTRYIVRLAQRCHSVTTAERLSFETPDEWLCDQRSDAVATGRENCPVATIEPARKAP